MAKDDLVSVNGTIAKLTGGGAYSVLLENGVEISAQLCGKMKKFKIRVIVGDKVTVGLSPYDPSHGLITHRFKA